jgi:RNA polymerase sigma factor (sigma-70 family)
MAGTQDRAAAVFDPLRPRLVRVAYQMLGSVADAEDVVQEAFLRWRQADLDAVREPEAWLRRVVTRLSLDVLKSARRRREVYVGPWLPEPVVEDAEEIEDVTLPLMLALERLSPLERAAFLLHDVFGAGFEEVAEALGRDQPACRQLASRARTHVRAARPRFDVPAERGMEIAEAFLAASRTGDVAGLKAMLTEDVALHSDGGPARRHGPGRCDEGVHARGRAARRRRAVGAGAGGSDQRPAGLRHPRGGRRFADHGAPDRGWPDRGDLRDAQPREAEAPGAGRDTALTAAGRPGNWRPCCR